MSLGDKPLTSGQYWQAIKYYKWPISRLSILLTVVAILLVFTIPPTYQGTAIIKFLPIEKEIARAAYPASVKTLDQQNISNQYKKMLKKKIAKGVLAKLKKFSLVDLDNELEKAISANEIIGNIKQKIRSFLPFMPQQVPEALSRQQLKMLKNNYTVEQVIQNLHLGYSSNKNEVTIRYKDQSATFAIIIAKLAADLYVQSVYETNIYMFEYVLDKVKQDNTSDVLPNTLNTNNASSHKLQIHFIDRNIELASLKNKKINRQLNDSRQRRKDMIFIQKQVDDYGLNVDQLMRHKRINQHPLIQPFKQNAELAEVKLSDITLLSMRVPSQVAVAKEELSLAKKILTSQLSLLISIAESYLIKPWHEVGKYKKQLKVSQQKLENLMKFQQEFNQFPLIVGEHQSRLWQEKLNQIASFGTKQQYNTTIFIGNYTSKRLKPNRVLIVSLSFFLSVLFITYLVVILVRLKAKLKINAR
jgi:uncharacterized protein involved in exopolysaccharide biosynthesis